MSRRERRLDKTKNTKLKIKSIIRAFIILFILSAIFYMIYGWYKESKIKIVKNIDTKLTKIEAEGILLLTRKENIFITDGRYMEYVSSIITPFDDIVVDDQKNISKDEYENFFLFCENVGFEEGYLTYKKYKEYIRKFKINNFVEAEELLIQLRMIKDDDEIANIKKACEITDNCFEMLKNYIKPGLTEKQIARKIHDYYMNNSEGESFETIVASGENSSKPHAVPTDRVIEKQDIITIDMGCVVNGYCSDMRGAELIVVYWKTNMARIFWKKMSLKSLFRH